MIIDFLKRTGECYSNPDRRAITETVRTLSSK